VTAGIRGRRHRCRRPGCRPDDAGLTLIELSVAMMIFAVIATVVGVVTIGSLRASRTVTTRVNSTSDARLAMESVTRTLRVAVKPERESSAITLATPAAVTFYALINRTSSTATPLPTKVEYYRDATSHCLMQALTPARTLIPATATDPLYAWDTGRSEKCIVRTTQDPGASDPWFSYFTTGQLTVGSVPVSPLAASMSGLSLSDRQSVVSVEFTLTVTDPGNPAVKGTSDRARVTLGNLIT